MMNKNGCADVNLWGSRSDWLSLGEHLCEASVAAMPSDGRRWTFDERPSSHGVVIDELEAVSRTFLLSSILATQGSEHSETSALLDVISARTDPRSELAWPTPSAGTSNVVLEAASIAIAFWLSRAQTWDRLPRLDQERIAQWLRSAVRLDTSRNNWVFFPAATALFLDAVGEGDGQGLRIYDKAVALSRSWRLGGGWYSDGPGASIDYYNSYAFHFYPAMLAWLGSFDDRLGAIREETREFLASFLALFDIEGGHVYFGRSLGYRFGATASLSVAALTGCGGDLGRLREVSSKSVRHFARHGALNFRDPLPLGWFERKPSLAQSYSGPRANYWASKAFVNLLIPVESSYWDLSNRPSCDAGDNTDGVVKLGGANMLVSRTDCGRTVRLHNHESWNVQSLRKTSPVDDRYYSRSTYSNITAPVDGSSVRDGGLSVAGPWGVSSRSELRPLGGGGLACLLLRDSCAESSVRGGTIRLASG